MCARFADVRVGGYHRKKVLFGGLDAEDGRILLGHRFRQGRMVFGDRLEIRLLLLVRLGFKIAFDLHRHKILPPHFFGQLPLGHKHIPFGLFQLKFCLGKIGFSGQKRPLMFQAGLVSQRDQDEIRLADTDDIFRHADKRLGIKKVNEGAAQALADIG